MKKEIEKAIDRLLELEWISINSKVVKDAIILLILEEINKISAKDLRDWYFHF